MTETELSTKLVELDAKLDAIYISAEKTRKYIKWTGIITIAFIIIPLILLPLFIPAFLASQGVGNLDTQSLQGL